MNENDFLVSILKDRIVESLEEIADVDFLDFIYKLLLAESG